MLNPPADVSGDTDAEERETVRCILAALDGSGLERVVAQSVNGARPGEGVGDLTVLHALEEGLRGQQVPAAIIRATYYMSNWDAALTPARHDGRLPTMFSADLEIPMIAPADMGRCAAGLLRGDEELNEPTVVEGPERYSSADVAAAFARALGRDVEPAVTPRDEIEDAFVEKGFSPSSARSYARMTEAALDADFGMPERSWRGDVSIDTYVRNLVQGGKS